jgi:hypothetical protein
MSNDIRGMDLLLLFTEEYPCWDRDTVECAGESFEDLIFLRESGLVASKDGIYQLTEAGRQRFREEAAASWYEAQPATDVSDPARALRRNRLVRLLDRAFLGRWGLKRALPGKKLPLVGDLSREEMVTLEGKNLSWGFLEHPFVQAFTQQYSPGRADTPPRNMEEFMAWRNSQGQREGSWELDLLMLHYCDFTEYMSYPAPKNDTLGLFCADRLFCAFLPEGGEGENPMPEMLETLGRWYLFMLGQRRLFMPYSYDVDPEEQNSVSWFFWVARTEEEARHAAAALKNYGNALAEPGMPCDIWVISEEALERQPRQQESFWDLFAEIAHPVSR